MDGVRIFDKQGQERDWKWLQAAFGAVHIERTQVPSGLNQVFRIVGLLVREGPAVQIAGVSNAAGKPMAGVRVARHWPDAPAIPEWPSPVSRWRAKGVYGTTNDSGNIGFGMGQGDYYYSTGGGASALWVADERGPSDFISGLGMVGGTSHRHLDVYFQLVKVAPSVQPPADPPKTPPQQPPAKPLPATTEERWQLVSDKLDAIIALLEKRVK